MKYIRLAVGAVAVIALCLIANVAADQYYAQKLREAELVSAQAQKSAFAQRQASLQAAAGTKTLQASYVAECMKGVKAYNLLTPAQVKLTGVSAPSCETLQTSLR